MGPLAHCGVKASGQLLPLFLPNVTEPLQFVEFNDKAQVSTRRPCNANHLGVILCGSMDFSEHIDTVVKKAMRNLGFLKRNCQDFHNVKSVKALYISLVRSCLDFCSVIWNPWQKNLVDKVERVQKKFIRYLCFKQNIPYCSSEYRKLCTFFKLPPLFNRRKVSDLCFLYKCIHSVVNSSYLTQIPLNVQRTLRFNCPFRVPATRINVRKYSFIPRALSTFNEIAKYNPNIDIFDRFSLFKTSVKNYFYT